MAPPDRELAERVHAVVTAAAPELAPKLWYDQPAWARSGKVVCFFRSGHQDKERCSTFGFSAERRRRRQPTDLRTSSPIAASPASLSSVRA